MHIVPKTPVTLMMLVYGKVFPRVNQELTYWKNRAQQIPNQELRKQALASIETKTFHCEGGAIYALLSQNRWIQAVRFIVAYQTISDYLDNLCDRSTSLDPHDFQALHESMLDALTPGNPKKNYYRYREEQEDGGYLNALVQTCQAELQGLAGFTFIQPYVHELASLYSDLQIHKHVVIEERIPRLQTWFGKHEEKWQDLSWFEFSAATGSTLGIFCLVSYTMGGSMTAQLAESIYKSYFPYMQGLHILLDYYIDQKEDQIEEDLNFCSYYDHEKHVEERLVYFIEQTLIHVKDLPNNRFHRMIQKGLVGMYLADGKVQAIKGARTTIPVLLNASGLKSKFFYFNTKLYHKIKPVFS